MEEKMHRGLSTREVLERQKLFGRNELVTPQKMNIFKKALQVMVEPMFLLLLCAAVIYFVLGEPRDGAIMLGFVFAIILIDVIQEWKTDKTLEALKELSSPQVKVLREGEIRSVSTTELVPGDIMLLHEGEKISADGVILACADFCVDESSLTGESQGVWKNEQARATDGYWKTNAVYAGTLVIQGTATVEISAIGGATEYGKIGVVLAETKEELTPLQKQTGSLVKLSAGLAAVLFALVSVLTYFNIPDHLPKDRVIESILSGITLAMAMIPEEFPVILTVFLSLGAWRLAKKNALVRYLPSVETLGAVSVLCVDKTGTITMNRMSVQDTWSASGTPEELAEAMGLGCEPNTYDPMEKAMLEYCSTLGISREHLFAGELLGEYSFTNELKMMGHIWRHDGALLVAAKGSPERILPLCDMTPKKHAEVATQMDTMSRKGLRVIAVGIMPLEDEASAPSTILDCRLTLLGLAGLADPPRPGVEEDIRTCVQSGIRVVMITGDNGTTASAIAGQIGMPHNKKVISGNILDQMSEEEIQEAVKDASIFSRVIPAHKTRIVKALKANGEIVAMTGDGVNDAPALKAADIGIAMGKRGSQVAREAADLILLDDDFHTIVDTIRDGRRIYDNIRKAVGYVFTIHTPIALASLLAPMLRIQSPAMMMLPLHVVLMELLIDPTCSVVLERQPAEGDIMSRPPRKPSEKLFTFRALFDSLLRGIVLFIASFGGYYLLLQKKFAPEIARSFGITVLLFGNLFLVQFISYGQSKGILPWLRLFQDKVILLVHILTLVLLGVILYTPVSVLLRLGALSASLMGMAFTVAALSVLLPSLLLWRFH